MSRQWVILGAGSQARETAEYLRRNGDTVLAYLVEAAYVEAASESLPGLVRAVGGPEARELHGISAVLGVGYPGLKRKLAATWSGDFGTVMSQAAWFAADAQIGAGTVVAPGAVVSVNVRLGRHVLVNIGATVSHDCQVGDFSTLSPGSHLAGKVEVGEGVFVGIGASVIEGIKIGAGSLIAAGAVVTKDVPPHTMVAGVPAAVKRPQPDWP